MTFALLCLAASALAQRGFGGFVQGRFRVLRNTPYDGRFTFVRVNYETAPGGYWAGGRPSWSHGYPLAERNLMKIMNEVSYLGAHDEEINTLSLEDPQLFKFPVAYIIEVGWWTLSDHGATALRDLSRQGRVPHRRRFQDSGLARHSRRRLGAVREEHAARAPWRAVLRHAGDTPDLPLVFRDQPAR